MAQRLPPLVWLKAFEAAGRLQSFRAAATELHVTASAVSHHIRSLEDLLARPLFQRSGNRVLLTREGALYLERISAGFAALASAGDVFASAPPGGRLTIGAFPFLASEVLMPCLAALRSRLPGVTLTVVSTTQLALLSDADPARRVDAIIRYGDGRFPACAARKLVDVSLVPVVAGDQPVDPQDAAERLRSGPRIAVAGPFAGWAAWSAGTGIALSAAAELLSFDSYLTAMRAVEQGLGAGIGIRPFIDPWLRAGRVRILLDRPVAVAQGSWLVTAHFSARRPELDVLAEWLLAGFEPAT